MSPLATVYAIRHNPTDAFLPSGRSRGFTHDEPTPANVKVPRLFLSRRAANLALKAWLAGEWREEIHYDGYSEVDRSSFEISPRPDRIPSEVAIVEISLLQAATMPAAAVLDSTDLRTIRTAAIAPSVEVENLLDIINRLAGKQLTDEDYSSPKEASI